MLVFAVEMLTLCGCKDLLAVIHAKVPVAIATLKSAQTAHNSSPKLTTALLS